MSFDPLLTALGLIALASPTTPATFAQTVSRSAVRIQSEADLPTTPGIGDIVMHVGALKWYNGSGWVSAGGGAAAGANTEIQYNDAGAFGATSEFAWTGAGGLVINKAPTTLAIGQQTYLNLGAGAAAGGYNSIYSSMTYAPATTNVVNLTGVYSSVIISGATAVNCPGVAYALSLVASSTKTANTVAQITGINVIQNNGDAGSTITLAHVLNASQSFSATTTTTGYGIHIQTSGAGTVGTYYGLRLQLGASAVTTHYGVYQEGTSVLNYFEGRVLTAASSVARAGLNIPHGVAPTVAVDGDVWSVTTTGLFTQFNGGTSLITINQGVPSAEGADRVVTNADNAKNLICTGTRVFTVNTGLVTGFGCSFKGTVSFDGTATVTDVRTSGAANPWCALCATGVDTYDIVGSKA